MKNSDLALVILIAVASVLLSFWIFGLVLDNPDERYVELKSIGEISADLDAPDIEVFNAYAINPTIDVIIGKCDEGEEWDDATQRCVSKGPNYNNENGDNSNPEPEL